MSLEIRVDLSGLVKLEARLLAALEEEVRATAQELAEAISSDAPVLTGDLRDSIEATEEDPLHYDVHDGGNGLEHVDYGVHVNYGAQGRPANPFFSRNVERVRAEFPERIAAVVRASVEEP